jgi:hypothetical protein
VNRNESGRFGALKSDSTHHFFRNAWNFMLNMKDINKILAKIEIYVWEKKL